MSKDETSAGENGDVEDTFVNASDDPADSAGSSGDDAVVVDAEVVDPAVDGEVTLGDVFADELVRISSERDEYLDALRRLQAEFENFRKRSDRLQKEAVERGTEAVIHRLLPALDALDLALAHVGESDGEEAGGLDPVFLQIAKLLRDVLAKEGLERIDEVGVAFDPTVHDAVAHESADADGDADATVGPSVVETMRAGYRLRGRVLRPAMVKVRA